MKPSKRIAKYNLSPRVENEVRVSRPQMGCKADYGGGRAAAIHLFCIGCMGGNRNDAAACQSFSCPLWQFRPGSKKGVRPPGIPTEAQYKEMIDDSVSQKQRDAGKKLRDGEGHKQ